MVERIEALLSEKKLSKKVFLRDLGLSINTFSNWRNRGNIPSRETLSAISEYLNVSVDYLLGNSEKPRQSVEFSESDLKVLNVFKSLTAEQQESLLDLMRSMRGKQGDL